MHSPKKWATCFTVYFKVEWRVVCLLGLCQCVWVFLDWETDQCSFKGYLYLLLLICLKNTCINGSSRSQFGNEIYLSLGWKKESWGEKIKERERENLLLGYSRSGFFPPFPSLSLKYLPSYELERFRTCLHREIYRPNYASIIRLINLPAYTSLNFESSIVSKHKSSEQLYFRPLSCACQLWADCRSLWPSFLISKQWVSLDIKSLH